MFLIRDDCQSFYTDMNGFWHLLLQSPEIFWWTHEKVIWQIVIVLQLDGIQKF